MADKAFDASHPERIRAREVAHMTGFSQRTIQIMAATGELPSALQRKRGGAWTFELLAIRRWIKRKEEALCQTTSIAAATPGTLRSPSAARDIDAAYKRLFARKRGGGGTRSSPS